MVLMVDRKRLVFAIIFLVSAFIMIVSILNSRGYLENIKIVASDRHLYPPCLSTENSTNCSPSKSFFGLDRYSIGQELHPDLLAVLEEWRERHANFVSEPSRHKYLICQENEYAGLGNRINALLTSLYIAVVTDRVLLVDWPVDAKLNADFHDLFETPFNTPIDVSTVKNSIDDSDIQRTLTDRPVQHVGEDMAGFGPTGLCEEQFGMGSVNVVTIILYNNILPLLTKNPHHINDPLIAAMNPETIYGDLLRWFLRPVPEVQKKVSSLRKKLNGRFSVGAQVRTGMDVEGAGNMDGSHSKSQLQLEKQIQCASAAAKTGLRRLAKVGKSPENRHPIYYIASDRVEVRNMYIGAFGEDNVLYQSGTPTRGSLDGVREALVDIWLLGDMDELVISTSSTFGMVGSALRGARLPYIITIAGVCYIRATSQPAINAPMARDYRSALKKCWNLEMEDLDTVNSLDHTELDA